LFAQLAELSELAGYALVAHADERIHDAYLDTRSGALQQRRMGLRVRRKDERWLVTLKRDAQRAAWGVARHEIELAWSREGWSEVVRELGRTGLSLAPLDSFDEAYPLGTLHALGLEVIQNRETHRHVRAVTSHTDEQLAELALDRCVYHLRDADVCCYEVEVELKAARNPQLLETLCDALSALPTDALRRWAHSKLATGFGLERLIAERGRAHVVDRRSIVKPEVCGELDAVLNQMGGD
ncbi:MAG: CYTH domain-containing protein, partial [Chloroflexi bacterium]|nr:CYTH domain-containing protein [Chloroflexota bacterium]